MRCLLDKVTARHIMEGMLKLVEGRSGTSTDIELFALYFYQRASSSNITLFILPQTYTLLKRLNHLSRYSMIIRRFLAATQVSYPARYFKRWARRLQEYGFTKEDAEVLALATFGTTPNRDILGMHIVATSDQPMINQWGTYHGEIQKRLSNMQRNLEVPYCHVSLPIVERPELIRTLR